MCVESREWENLSEAVEVMAGAFIGDMTPEEKVILLTYYTAPGPFLLLNTVATYTCTYLLERFVYINASHCSLLVTI